MKIIFGINASNTLHQKSLVLVSWKKVLIIVMFVQIILSLSPAFACDAPAKRFCVDFFKGTDLDGKPLYTGKAPYIKYNWANRSPARGVAKDNFSARWSGQFDFKDGEYEFRALADDGVRILLDGQPILDHWQEGAVSEYLVEVNPGAGKHLVEVEYFDAVGNAQVQVAWKHTSTTSPLVIAPKETVTLDKAVPTTPIASSAVLNTIVPATTTTQTITAVPANKTAPTSVVTASSITTAEALAMKAAAVKSKAKNNPVINAPKPNVNKAPIGVNLSYFSYSNAAVPFKDLIIQSGLVGVIKNGSNDACPQQPDFDTDGYPRYLPTGCKFRLISVFHILNDKFWPNGALPYESGRYVLLYRGKGQIKLSWDASNVKQIANGRIEFDVPRPAAGIVVEVLETEASDPVRDLHMVHVNDEATFRTQPFNEKWLALLKPFSVVRFMDWGRVSETIKAYTGKAVSHTENSITLASDAPTESGIFSNQVAMLDLDGKWPRVMIDRYDGKSHTIYLKSPIETAKNGSQPTVYIRDFSNKNWGSRTQPATLDQGSFKGVAFEYMLKLANIMDASPWINIPTAADDAFVEQLAQLIKSQLKPNLQCYIEYSNETWNTKFPGFDYAEAKARELGLTGGAPIGDAWHAYRAVEIFKIFNRVFAEPDLHDARTQSRLVRVLTGQTAGFERAKRIMDWHMPNKAHPTEGFPSYKFADAWAVTTYFTLDDLAVLEQPVSDVLFAILIDNINKLFGTSQNPGVIRQVLAETQLRNLQMVAYEGGAHLLAPTNRPDLIEKLAVVNQSQAIKGVYSQLLDQWNQLYLEFGKESVGVLNHYSDISRYDQHGYWGLMQSSNQEISTAPKYQAIKNYVQGLQ